LAVWFNIALSKTNNSSLHCGVMKFLADMPSCLGGEEFRINVE